MCGITGKINFNNKIVKKSEIQRMLKEIKHRGPDGEGIYVENNIGMGHVLLKIQDISDNSKQPFFYKNLCLVYNGEIYNYKQLKRTLKAKGYSFETTGDTEILIKIIDYYGLEKALKKVEGCFAFALYNKDKKTTILVRDRFGIKPLYYYRDNNRLIYSSEIKGILTDERVPKLFNLEKVLISFNCKLWLDNETTFFKNINAITPGHYLVIDENYEIKDVEYYKLKFNEKYDNPDKLIDDFGKEFEKSVKKKLISKVPIAAFLSGGLDSSIVCKLLNNYSKQKLNTYTICYDFDDDLDLNHATELSNREDFEQHNILISEEMYNLDNIDKVTYGVEEILIDKVYIPMYFNYKAAKDDGFTVVVSGQGSDEVWLGYVFTWKIFKYLKERYNKETLIKDYYIDNMLFKKKLNKECDKMIPIIMKNYLDNFLVETKDELNSYADLSLKTILHDLLVQEDKIAMMSSVESRVPFVDDHKIVELAYKASSQIKLFDGREKYIVRKYCKGKINDSIVEREKYPFPEPPKIYNNFVTKLCEEHWDKIKKSKIVNKVINKKELESVSNFTEMEQWWLLVYWRFETVFNMEVE